MGPPRPSGGHRRDARAPPPDPRRGGDRLRERPQSDSGDWLRGLGDNRALPVHGRPGPRGANSPRAHPGYREEASILGARQGFQPTRPPSATVFSRSTTVLTLPPSASITFRALFGPLK